MRSRPRSASEVGTLSRQNMVTSSCATKPPSWRKARPEKREAAPDAELRERLIELRSRAMLLTNYFLAAVRGRAGDGSGSRAIRTRPAAGRAGSRWNLWDVAPRVEARDGAT